MILERLIILTLQNLNSIIDFTGLFYRSLNEVWKWVITVVLLAFFENANRYLFLKHIYNTFGLLSFLTFSSK